MKLVELGERVATKRLAKILGIPFEDASTIKTAEGRHIIVNVDTFVRKTDAPPQMPILYYGYKVAISASSDVLVKGARPSIFLLSISVPGSEDFSILEQIVSGAVKACRKYGILYGGGDLNEADDLVLTGVALGFASRFIPRSGVSPGDYIWTTGEFGLTGAALHYLLSGGKPTKGLNKALKAFYEPELRLEILDLLLQKATASVDSSDGLAESLWALAESSGVKIEIERIPLAEETIEYARRNNIDPHTLALYGGEEFEIIFATKEKIEDPRVHYIGRAREGEGVVFRGKKIERGYEHFKTV